MKKLLVTLALCANIFAAPSVGDKGVSFKLPNLYNETSTTTAASLEGKVVLLNLWASWCGGCQEEMPLFVALQEEYAGKDFKIVLSSIDSDPENAIEFLKEVDDKRVLTALYDEGKTLPKGYRCIGMPSSYLLDKDGKVVKVYVGSLDEDAIKSLKSTINTLLGK
jgi:thiol-disulfide isomerase/thioredoxin